MSLEVYSRYHKSDSDQTVVAVRESDQNEFVRIDAQLSGNLTDLSDSELLERALAWFTNRYIQTYANQKLDEKVREIDGLTGQMTATLETAKASIAENKLAVEACNKAAELVESKIDKSVSELTTLIMSFMASLVGGKEGDEEDEGSPEEEEGVEDEAVAVAESSEEEGHAEESSD